MPARIAIVLLVLVTLAGCGEDDGGAAGSDRLTVVATTTQAADLARNVGGENVEVVGLLAPNADPHEYEVRPRDLQALTDADLVVRSGGDLDEWLAEAIEGSGSEAPVVTLIDQVKTIEGEHGHEEEEHAGEEEEHAGEEEEHEIDPHWWQDPRNAIIAVAEIERALAAADSAHADAYAANADRYEARLRELDRAVAACIDQVPAGQRKLVTTHDALGYYAQRYGIEVIGAVIPSLSTSGQPSAGETADLIETIRDEDVKAIFAESSVNAKVEEAISRETGAAVGKALWADTLGPAGSDGETYVASIAANTRALVDGFTGGEQTCTIDA
jgi:ABC-type Zn uptake system ZnuABC Zn-binding protein ZnuA